MGEATYRAVILKVDRIGDFVLCLGAIRQALAAWGETECLLVVSPVAAELAALEFPRTPRLVLPASVGKKRLLNESLRARRRLARVSCDLLVSFRNQRWDFDELTLHWISARRKLVLEDQKHGWLVESHRTYLAPGVERVAFVEAASFAPSVCRELLRHRQLLSAALGRELSLSEIMPILTRLGSANGPVVVCPLGSDPIRDIPVESLAAALGARPDGTSIRILGSPGQSPRLTGIVDALQAHGISNVTVETSLSMGEFVSALAGACLVLSAESAAAHLATALDQRAILFIGGGHYGQFGPWSRSGRQVWLVHRVPCFGCDWRCIYPEPICLSQIPAESVRSAATSLLGASR